MWGHGMQHLRGWLLWVCCWVCVRMCSHVRLRVRGHVPRCWLWLMVLWLCVGWWWWMCVHVERVVVSDVGWVVRVMWSRGSHVLWWRGGHILEHAPCCLIHGRLRLGQHRHFVYISSLALYTMHVCDLHFYQPP